MQRVKEVAVHHLCHMQQRETEEHLERMQKKEYKQHVMWIFAIKGSHHVPHMPGKITPEVLVNHP
jgi:hypothetical protein